MLGMTQSAISRQITALERDYRNLSENSFQMVAFSMFWSISMLAEQIRSQRVHQ